MNLLMTAWSFYPAQEGGPSNALFWLASGLAKEGYQLRVVTTNRYIPENSVPINKWYDLNGFKVIYQSLDQGQKLLYKELDRCDVLLTDGVCKISYYKLVLSALKKKKKVILSPRGELFESAINHKGFLYGLLKKAFIRIMRVSFMKRVWFHATSEEEKKAVLKYMGNKASVSVIPNYMILPDVVNDQFIKERKEYLLYVGRLNPIKNIDILLEGLSLSNVFKNSQMLMKIAGAKEGEYFKYLKDLVKRLDLESKVEFVGHVTGAAKEMMYANAKCLLLVSKSENFGNVVIEALRQGTPVIASKGTPWETLSKQGAGYWIDAKASAIGQAIDSLLQMSTRDYDNMRNNAFMLSKTFDIYSNMSGWNSLLLEKL